jgi:WD40 repeat protein
MNDRRYFMFFLLLTLLLIFSTDPTPITADNIDSLQSVQTVDFEDVEELRFNSGWFALSPDGHYIAVPHSEGGLVIWSTHGEVVDKTILFQPNDEPMTLLDADFSINGTQIAAVYTDGVEYFIDIHTVMGESETLDYDLRYGRPLRVWMDDDEPYVWLETAPEFDSDAGYQVVKLPLRGADGIIKVLPSAPEGDTEAFVRIGRIPAPYAVTSTPEGLVRLWHLQSGEILHEAQLDTAPVFGRVNETTGRYMAWRDPASQTLQLLDFEGGDSTLLAELDGAYIQALMVTPDGAVVLGVHIGEDAVVAAWDVETGARYDLGAYRQCSRVPDFIQLSRDGTTLVIGCDTGFDIWQIR